jgi:hypothetical protein
LPPKVEQRFGVVRAQINQLSALAGGDYSFASAVNDEGEVAGAANTGESIIPFVWTTSGGIWRRDAAAIKMNYPLEFTAGCRLNFDLHERNSSVADYACIPAQICQPNFNLFFGTCSSDFRRNVRAQFGLHVFP